MVKVALVATSLLLICGNALAADLSRPLPMLPAVPALAGWSGFYLGLNAGGALANGRSDFSTGGIVFASATNSLSGALGGVQAGYNWQTGPMVLGVETDFQFTSLKGSLDAPCSGGVCGVPLTATYTQKVPWFGTVRGRVGYASMGWLLYVTGGYTYARLDNDAFAAAGATSATFSLHETRSGWNVGGGAEVALAPGWSAKVEYLYLDLGHRTTIWAFTGLPTITDDRHFFMNVVRAGVNYRF
jgi:outer membrane immunogenic protein